MKIFFTIFSAYKKWQINSKNTKKDSEKKHVKNNKLFLMTKRQRWKRSKKDISPWNIKKIQFFISLKTFYYKKLFLIFFSCARLLQEQIPSTWGADWFSNYFSLFQKQLVQSVGSAHVLCIPSGEEKQ